MSSSRAAMGTLAARRRCVDPAFRRKRLCREETTGRRSADKWNMIRPMIRLLVSLSYKPSIASKNSARDSGEKRLQPQKADQKRSDVAKGALWKNPRVAAHARSRKTDTSGRSSRRTRRIPSHVFLERSRRTARHKFTSTRRPTPIIHAGLHQGSRRVGGRRRLGRLRPQRGLPDASKRQKRHAIRVR